MGQVPDRAKKRYIIAGFGCAGYTAAREIRRFDEEGDITVLSSHGMAPYNPMLTTYYVSGKLSFEGMFPFGTLGDITRKLRLDMRVGVSLARVNGARHTAELSTGETVSYDRLLIATGASAFAPRFEGLCEEDAYFMRTVDDARRLKERLEREDIDTALVVGASMVGIKVSELLLERGIKTYLADIAEHIFPLAAYPGVSAEIERRTAEKGLRLALGSGLERVKREGKDLVCSMSDGSEIRAQLIVLCIGTRPNVSMLNGEEVYINKGIVVDGSMRTSCADIFAAGDCAEGRELQSGGSMVIGLWANAAHQGAAAGCAMTGGEESFSGNFPHNITHFMGMDFIGFGDSRVKGETVRSGNISSGLYVEAVLSEGRLAGVNILDNYRISGAIKNYLYRLCEGRAEPVSPVQRGILIKEGLRPSFIEKMEGSCHGR